MHALAGHTTSGGREPAVVDVAAHGMAELIDQLPMPAFVGSRWLDVLAANPLARALCPGFALGRSFLCWQLLDPAARDFYVDRHEATDVVVSALREAAGSDPDDPRLRSVVDELSTASERFRELWARADVGYPANVAHIRHPLVGDLYLHRNKLTIPHSGGQQMLIFRAEPGSESAQALERLQSLSTDHADRLGPF